MTLRPILSWMASSIVVGALALPGGAAAKASFADLVANLKSPTVRTRQDAAAALGKTRRREAVGPLSTLVRDPEVRVRLEVVRALREIRDLEAVPHLVTAMGDGDPTVRSEALGALVETYSGRERSGSVSKYVQDLSDEYDRATLTQPNADPAVYRVLASALRDEDKAIRTDAAYSLGILNGRPAVRDLESALQDVEPGVRGAAASAIGKIAAAEGGRVLVPLLADENADVRHRTLQALGTLRTREASAALREMFEANRKRELGTRTLRSLSRIADPSQAELFREMSSDTDGERRRYAIEGLARVGDTSLLTAFKKDFQREKNDELRLAHAFALVKLGDRAFVDSLVLALTSRLSSRSRGYLLELGPGLLPEIYPYLNDEDASLRAELADLLADLGDPEAAAKLAPLVNDPNPKVADRANRAVERLRNGSGSASR